MKTRKKGPHSVQTSPGSDSIISCPNRTKVTRRKHSMSRRNPSQRTPERIMNHAWLWLSWHLKRKWSKIVLDNFCWQNFEPKKWFWGEHPASRIWYSRAQVSQTNRIWLTICKTVVRKNWTCVGDFLPFNMYWMFLFCLRAGLLFSRKMFHSPRRQSEQEEGGEVKSHFSSRAGGSPAPAKIFFQLSQVGWLQTGSF